LPWIVSFRQLEGGNTAALGESMFKDPTCPADVTGSQKRLCARKQPALL
jgi:hypothetical protein